MSSQNRDNQGNESKKEEVFFELFMTSQKSLHAYILSSVHNYADANDLLQDTAAVLWQKFDQFDPETNFLAWAIAIARNMIRNHFSKRNRSRLNFGIHLTQKIEEATIAQLSSDNEAARMDSLKKCYENLSDSGRYLLKLRFEEGMTVKAIATRLGRPLQGMYKAMARLQDSLQRCIEKTMAMEKD